MIENQIKNPSIKVNALLNIARTLMTVVFPLVTFPYSSRILLPEGIGRVRFARSFVDFFILLATLGIYVYGTREIAKVKDDKVQLSKVTTEILTINLVSTTIAYFLFFIAIFTIPKLSDYRLLLIVISTKILFTALGLDWLYSGIEDYKYITLRAFIFQIISVVLLFTFVHTKEDYLKYASIAVFSNVGSNICNWIHSKKFINISFRSDLELKKHLKPIFILFAMAVTSNLYSIIDVTMLGFMCNDWQVGIYTTATKINSLITSLVVSGGIVVLPRLSYYVKNQAEDKFQELAYKNYDILFLFAIPSTIGLCLVGKAAVLAFSGENFIASIPIMRMMNLMIIIVGISCVTGTQTLIPLGKEILVFYAMLTGALTDIILNFALIPHFQAYGAAVATVISESILSIFELACIRKKLSLKKIGRFFTSYLFNSAVMALFVILCLLLIPGLWLSSIIAICVGIVVYGALLVLEKNHFVMDMFKLIKKKVWTH